MKFCVKPDAEYTGLTESRGKSLVFHKKEDLALFFMARGLLVSVFTRDNSWRFILSHTIELVELLN